MHRGTLWTDKISLIELSNCRKICFLLSSVQQSQKIYQHPNINQIGSLASHENLWETRCLFLHLFLATSTLMLSIHLNCIHPDNDPPWALLSSFVDHDFSCQHKRNANNSDLNYYQCSFQILSIFYYLPCTEILQFSDYFCLFVHCITSR